MMTEWWLLISFLLLSIFGIGIALYPLRHSYWTVLLAPLLFVWIGLAYWHFGAWSAWVSYLHESLQQQRAQHLMESMRDPDALIEKLQSTLRTQPNSARGWYLLGRLYASQQQWQSADNAFERAYQLQPNDAQIAVNYVQNNWQLNHQQYNERTREILNDLLQRNSNQLDALAMLAMDAYQQQQYQRAIDYWQRLLTLVPMQSEEAQAIRKAIANAARHIK